MSGRGVACAPRLPSPSLVGSAYAAARWPHEGLQVAASPGAPAVCRGQAIPAAHSALAPAAPANAPPVWLHRPYSASRPLLSPFRAPAADIRTNPCSAGGPRLRRRAGAQPRRGRGRRCRRTARPRPRARRRRTRRRPSSQEALGRGLRKARREAQRCGQCGGSLRRLREVAGERTEPLFWTSSGVAHFPQLLLRIPRSGSSRPGRCCS